MKRVMFGRTWGILFLLLSAPSLQAADSVEELQQQMMQLMKQVQTLQHKLHEVAAEQQAKEMENAAEVVEVQAAETAKQDWGDKSKDSEVETSLVDLSPQEHSSIDDAHDSHVLSNPWWKNFEIHGFGAAGYYDTGSAGTRDFGGFEIKESSLFVEADVWNDISFFLEVQANRLGKDDQLFVRTGEVYAHFRDIPVGEVFSFGTKLGRIDIPFGEEYLWQDAIDNPLITNSAAYPYSLSIWLG